MPRKKLENPPETVAPAVVDGGGGDSILNTISVPITELRWELASLQKAGADEYPLGDLLFLIRDIVRKKKEEE